MKLFPRLGEILWKPDSEQEKSNEGSPCYICKTKTKGKICVQNNYFRGDDSVINICSKCIKPKNEILFKINKKQKGN